MKFNSQSITITTASVHDLKPVAMKVQSKTRFNSQKTKERAEALAVLVGGEYNKYARHTDPEDVAILTKKFEEILLEMQTLMNK